MDKSLELADELEIAQGNNNADELIPKAITMLRQLQAEIEVLKETLQGRDRYIDLLMEAQEK